MCFHWLWLNVSTRWKTGLPVQTCCTVGSVCDKSPWLRGIDLARNGNSGCANEILGCAKCHFWWKSPWKWKNLDDFKVCNYLNCPCKTRVHRWLAKTMLRGNIYSTSQVYQCPVHQMVMSPTAIKLVLRDLWYRSALVNTNVFSDWSRSIALKPINLRLIMTIKYAPTKPCRVVKLPWPESCHVCFREPGRYS